MLTGSTQRSTTVTRNRIMAKLKTLEGHRVSVALKSGSRIDDCQLVSGGRRGTGTVWLFANGADLFVSLSAIVDIWEAPLVGRAA